MNIKDRLYQILNGYAAISNLPDYHDKALEVAVQQIKILFDYEEGKGLEERKQEFIELLRPYMPTYGKEMLNSFGEYWLEISPKGKKYRFEKENAFDISRRLAVWAKTQKKFSIANILRK